jgi:hypothetical protein
MDLLAAVLEPSILHTCRSFVPTAAFYVCIGNLSGPVLDQVIDGAI